MQTTDSPPAARAVYLTTAEALRLFKGLVQPPPSRRTVMLWLRRHRVRSVRPTGSRVGGASYLWHRGDVEKLQTRFATGKL
ncbi:MAG: hypothetical protein KF833_21425 [Verrucomicrobiae bacterium]|nr:hypothetical protein [Verrucomicrobiae bacterium]